MLVQEKELPASVMRDDYHDLISDHRKVVDSAMPLVFGYEVDSGIDHNNTNLQNMCAYIADAILLRSDQSFICCGCWGYLYLNTCKNAMPLINIGISNHSCCINPDTPNWLCCLLQSTSSLNQVRDAIYNFDDELEKAKNFKTINSQINSKAKSSLHFPEKPTANASVKKFVDFDGWYNGTVVSVVDKTVNVKLDNNTEEQWSETAYTGHREATSIEIGEVG